jgi:hypothetical protein
MSLYVKYMPTESISTVIYSPYKYSICLHHEVEKYKKQQIITVTTYYIMNF